MARFASGGGGLRYPYSDGNALLFCLLPDHHAASRFDRKAQASAELYHRGSARKERGQNRDCPSGDQQLSRREMKDKRMKTFLKNFASLGVVPLVAMGVAIGGAFAQEDGAGEVEAFPIHKPREQNWSFSGPFGTYDKAQLQRGLKVYKEVCAACHSLD